ncbi:MAG TPA: hypothetical protein VJW76_09755 [Verrucomicrobiae bacterium]|nr:hypothetical protein [Verrucomicrobiae bacterium]
MSTLTLSDAPPVTSAATGLELHLKVNPVVEDVTNVTGGGLCCRLLALVERRCALRLNRKMAVMQLANANSDLTIEPNCDVSNLCVSRRNRDNETVSEVCAKTVAWHRSSSARNLWERLSSVGVGDSMRVRLAA